MSHSGCNYSQKCYWGDYEDEYRLKKAGKDCLFQDVILQCIRRSVKKKLESVTLLELKKDVLLCAFLCRKRSINGVAQHSKCRMIGSVERRTRKVKGVDGIVEVCDT